MSAKVKNFIFVLCIILTLGIMVCLLCMSSPRISGEYTVNPAPRIITEETISINTADTNDLMRLPGIGESTAKKIISYREENGCFSSLEDIMNIKGIGESTYKRLLPFIKL